MSTGTTTGTAAPPAKGLIDITSCPFVKTVLVFLPLPLLIVASSSKTTEPELPAAISIGVPIFVICAGSSLCTGIVPNSPQTEKVMTTRTKAASAIQARGDVVLPSSPQSRSVPFSELSVCWSLIVKSISGGIETILTYQFNGINGRAADHLRHRNAARSKRLLRPRRAAAAIGRSIGRPTFRRSSDGS